MYSAEDKFGRGHLAEMLNEGGLPWRRRSCEVVHCGRHSAEEAVEAEGGFGDGSYDC